MGEGQLSFKRGEEILQKADLPNATDGQSMDFQGKNTGKHHAEDRLELP